MKTRIAALSMLGAVTAFLACAGQAQAAERPENTIESVTERLARTTVDVSATNEDPDKVLDIIREKAGINIVVGPEVRRRWEQQTVSLKLKGVSALSALHHILRQLGVVSTYANEALVIVTPEAAEPDPQITIYDIRDITETPRGNRLPPQLFGGQIDPLYYYWVRGQLGPLPGTGVGTRRDPFGELDLLDRYPPDPIGEVIATTIEQKLGGKDTGVSVSYHDGYLVVVEHPEPARLPFTPTEEEKETTKEK
ncbi:MAG: hypothetical protein ACLF0G_11925 [Candidatus Brocadiia bacterium]